MVYGRFTIVPGTNYSERRYWVIYDTTSGHRAGWVNKESGSIHERIYSSVESKYRVELASAVVPVLKLIETYVCNFRNSMSIEEYFAGIGPAE